ncbi:MAG: SpaA isopeptide-forming pilin-related protein [Oscillospiraceae bacterium]|nr:SpaA isopeptide-forming pilin-related protein [Oscillospiraceae bacterium]
MRKKISLILALVMLISLVSIVPAQAQTIDITPTQGGTVQFVRPGHFIYVPGAWQLPGGTRTMEFFQMRLEGNLYPIYCLEPLVAAPLPGNYAYRVLANNLLLARALYYSFGAPGQRYYLDTLANVPLAITSFTGSQRGDSLYILSRITLAYIYGAPDAFFGINATGIAAARAFRAWLETAPHPPHANKSFSNANVNATLNIAENRQETPWITFNADTRNAITMPVSNFGTGVTLQRNRGGTITGHTGNVELRGGDQFRLFAPLPTPAGIRNSGDLRGTETRHWYALLFNENNPGTQVLGGWSYRVDPADPIRFAVTWREAHGSLRINKTVENWHTRAGFEFEVRRVTGNVLIGNFTTNANGYVYVPNLVAGDYSVREIVPYGFVAPTPNPRVITVVAGQTGSAAANTTFNNVRQQGRIRVEKHSTNPGMSVYNLAGAVFEIRNAGGTVVETITTNAEGIAESNLLPLGAYTVVERTAPYGFVLDPTPRSVTLTSTNQTATVFWGNVSVGNRPQVGRITITKLDRDTGDRPQGDATLNGAIFDIFAARDIRQPNGTIIFTQDQLVDTIYTGTNNVGTSRELPLGDYYFVERVAPHGYTLNTERHPVTIAYDGQLVTVSNTDAELLNRVIQGRIALVKFTDPDTGNQQIMPPLEGAIFDIFLRSAGSFENALPTERARITTDANGFAETGYLPFGWYTVREVYAPGDVRLVDPFDVFISQDGQIHRFILSNPIFESLIRIVKTDATTGQTIPAAGVAFRIRDLATGQWVSQTFNYPTPTEIDIFHTNEEGWLVMPLPLRSGQYELHEISAPYGYLLSREPVQFTVHSSVAGENDIIEVIMANDPAMGVISVRKVGNMLVGTEVAETDFGYKHVPAFAERGLPGAVFNIIAAEDIITPDGTVRAVAGEIVDTITTNANGNASSRPLFLGNYHVVEIYAPQGFVLDETPKFVTLAYIDQYTPIVHELISRVNVRQRVAIELDKWMETLDGQYAPYHDVVFGLFAYDDILCVDGEIVIEAGDLVSLITLNDVGISEFVAELPWANFIIRELATAEGYRVTDEDFEVSIEPADQGTSVIKIAVNDGEPIHNYLMRGDLRVIKTFEGRETPIAGVPFTIIGETVVGERIEINAETDENGEIVLEGLPIGEWTVTELSGEQNEGFILSEPVTVTLTEDELVELAIHNYLMRGDLRVIKTFEGRETPIAGVPFTIIGETVVGERIEINAETDENGEIVLEGLLVGEWTVIELASELNEGFILSEEQTITIAANKLAEMSIHNYLIRGCIHVTKRSSATGNVLAGTVFGLYQDGVRLYEATTGEDGVAIFERFPSGDFVIYEVQAPTGYLIADEGVNVTIYEEGQIVAIDFTNDPIPKRENPHTGDGRNLPLFIALMVLSSAGLPLAFMAMKRKRKTKA